MPDDIWLTNGEFRRAVAWTITIVPGLCEMLTGICDDIGVERLIEVEQYAVGPDFVCNRQRRKADASDALQRAIRGRVSPPPCHTADIKLAVVWVKSCVLRSRFKCTRDQCCRTLPDTVYLLSGDKESAACTIREVDEVSVPA